MPAWLIPALKAVLPHVGTIVSVAAPAFTKMRSGAADNPATVQQQIAELQAAASQNATHIRELAAQLQATVTALEQAAAVAEARQRRLMLLCTGAVVLSALALAVVLLKVYAA
ncbi:MAG: hypothetical protein KF771_12030 [Burkholderiales bacterium]|nr:hypothetical protein [Burkholderiales bacterium]